MTKSFSLTKTALMLGFALALTACTGNDEKEKEKGPGEWVETGKKWDGPPNADVYVVGFGERKLWKNGATQSIPNLWIADRVFVSGDDVYIVGREYVNFQVIIASVWKNGVQQRLGTSNASSRAWSIFVSGDDVYVAGSQESANKNRIATLWVNGKPQYLSDGVDIAEAWSVFVSDNDVYVGGEDNGYPVLWKNGEAQRLLYGYGGSSGFVSSVFVSDKNVYAAVFDWVGVPRTTLWKNDNAQILEVGSSPYSLFVSGEDVYLTGEGYGSTGAILWKNGEKQVLSGEHPAGSARSVFVSGGNVYVGGHQGESVLRYSPTLWINDEVFNLKDYGFSVGPATSVFVVERER